MTFADAVNEAPRTGIPCSVGEFLHELAEKNPVEAGYFNDFLFEKNARGWRHSYTAVLKKIAKESEDHGYQTVVKKSQVNRHRARGCRCDEGAS